MNLSDLSTYERIWLVLAFISQMLMIFLLR